MFKRKWFILLTVMYMLFIGVQGVHALEQNQLPNIKILATGGTIAGSAPTNTKMTGYTVGEIRIQTLINAVPAIRQYANVSGEQIANIGSNDMTDEVWLKLAKRTNELLADPKINGVVITHGTDTLEETAYFLNLVVKSDKPVVLVGAMRPATAISADGPVNLLNAVRLAASKSAAGQGVLVAMNDEINGARDVTKTNTSHVSTFKAPELGYLGYFNDGEPYFYRKVTRKHTKDTEFDVRNLTELPDVEIIYTHVNENRALIDAAVAAGARGIVYAGSGMGSIHRNAEPALVDAQKKGVVIVRSSRTGNGIVTPSSAQWTAEHFLDGDNLNPQKARVLLQLALTKTTDLAEIQRMFNEY
ncbi:type II asparaginase [Propionispora sp. 2/2-37]|uniref:type II asparaginase n=1 Tax=Propionispora sp. 2/2-37 TaxID=1677858 RepID=UPI0006BB830E|nr:type II asparaginase [Propionispora sp. 2/2-37]